MKTIYKYVVPHDGTEIQMPIGAEILTVAMQVGEIYIWAIVDTDNKFETRKFIAQATGREMPEGKLKYIGTVFIGTMLMELVFHVFEKLKELQ